MDDRYERNGWERLGGGKWLLASSTISSTSWNARSNFCHSKKFGQAFTVFKVNARAPIFTEHRFFQTTTLRTTLLFQTNGKSRTPDQSNLKVNIVGLNGLPDVEPQEFINYISRTYGVVSPDFINKTSSMNIAK